MVGYIDATFAEKKLIFDIHEFALHTSIYAPCKYKYIFINYNLNLKFIDSQLIELTDLLRKRQQGQYYKRTQMDESHMINNMSSHMTYTTTMSPAAPPDGDEPASTPGKCISNLQLLPLHNNLHVSSCSIV